MIYALLYLAGMAGTAVYMGYADDVEPESYMTFLWPAWWVGYLTWRAYHQCYSLGRRLAGRGK